MQSTAEQPTLCQKDALVDALLHQYHIGTISVLLAAHLGLGI